MANLHVGQRVRIVYTLRQFWREGSEDVIIADLGELLSVDSKKRERFWRLAGDQEPAIRNGPRQAWVSDQLEPILPDDDKESITTEEELEEMA